VLGLTLDECDHALPKVDGRDEQAVVLGVARVACQVVEEVGRVLAEQRVGGEDADVRVYARGRRVVVARGDVDVAAQALALAPDDERLRATLRARTRAAPY